MGIQKRKQPKLLKEFIWPAKMIHIATDALRPLAAFPQYAAQASPGPAVKRRKRPLMAMFEIFKPSLKRSIHIRRDSGQTVAIAAPGLGTDGVFELLQTLLAGPPCASLKVVSEEVEAVTRKGGIHHAGLLRVQDKTPFRDQLLHLVQSVTRLRLVTTHNDKVIGVSDHLIARRLHRHIHRMEVEVRQKRAYDCSLWRSLLGSPCGQTLHDVLTEETLNQGQHAPISNIPTQFLHQQLMGNAVKVRFKIGIHHAGVTGFQEPVNLSQGVLASSVWPKSVAVPCKSHLENGLDHESQCCLDDQVTHGRYAQRPILVTAEFVYINPSDEPRAVYPRAKLFFESGNVQRKILLELFYALMIRSGASPVPSDCLPG